RTFVYACVSGRSRVYTSTFTCPYVNVYVSVSVRLRVRISTFTCTYVNVCVRVRLRVRTCTYVYMLVGELVCTCTFTCT
uniref:Uncharacterized protein n=1 Tax=Parascaris univalens TaxID=6257 RepID=A0A915A481_PARUN